MRCDETRARHRPCLDRYVAFCSERSRMLCRLDGMWTARDTDRYIRLSLEDRHGTQNDIVSKSRESLEFTEVR